MDFIEVYDLEYKDWGNYQLATAANASNSIPKPRLVPCSIIARAKDGSSYNIYMFGGLSLVSKLFRYSDVWVLSIPSFKWFLVDTKLSTMWVTPPGYVGMTCHIVGGGSKMLVYGGRESGVSDLISEFNCDDKTGVHVFDMTKLTWEKDYDPNGEYQVPKEIYDVIGGSPYGGATLLPENGMANSYMEATFKEIIAKAKSTGEPDDTPATIVRESSKSGVSGGEIAGIVVGVFIGISLIILGILWLRSRSKARARGPDILEINGTSYAEMSTKLALQELHPYCFAHHAQELHAYMPSEMPSTINEGASHNEPVNLELSDKQTVVEGSQDCTYQGHGEEGVQGQSDYSGSDP